MSAGTKQKENYRRQRLAKQPKSIEAVLASCAGIEASLPSLPSALQEYLSRVRAWAIARRDERMIPNMGLVGQLVHRKYRAALDGARVNLDDAMQEGAIGLMHGAELFDESRGVVFSTYAVRWIQQRIGVLLDNAHLVHAPKYLFSENDQRLTAETRKYKEVAARSRQCFTLSTLYRPDRDGQQSAEAMIEEPGITVDRSQTDASLDLEPLLRSLHPRYRMVIELRFLRGLALDEIGAEMAKMLGEKRVARERVRQMVEQGLQQMRKRARVRVEAGK